MFNVLSIVGFGIGDVLFSVVLQHHALVAKEGDNIDDLVVVELHPFCQIGILQRITERFVVIQVVAVKTRSSTLR